MFNHLEQLIAEWHEHRGYFVRRNVLLPGSESLGQTATAKKGWRSGVRQSRGATIDS